MLWIEIVSFISNKDKKRKKAKPREKDAHFWVYVSRQTSVHFLPVSSAVDGKNKVNVQVSTAQRTKVPILSKDIYDDMYKRGKIARGPEIKQCRSRQRETKRKRVGEDLREE